MMRLNHIPELSMKLKPTLLADLTHRDDQVQMVLFSSLDPFFLFTDSHNVIHFE